ncbi:copper resistance protein [Zhengella mangrovi]|uniref:Copper resistance protein n=1 Tax=Zhengella mangrovi TaxID=1982044 RepID=A0A2G1QH21_9HYPH|nr:TolC family protein [Zhengella mangrovi]PHP64761.1 copper resistance protein [Zhengella mangrovi]
MTPAVIKRLTGLSAVILSVSGCVSAEQVATYSAADAGFAVVKAETAAATRGKQTVWIQNRQQASELAARVHGLVHRKTISDDTAVQVALLNNRGLQASYAALGMSAAEAWQQTMLENPKVSIGLLGIGTPELGLLRAVEAMIAQNILALATRERRVDIADTEFRRASAAAVNDTLRLAIETRRAWINAVSAFETVAYLNQAKAAADAASELAQKLGESGALPKAGQAREHAFYAELTGQMAEARLAAQLAKEELTRLMGLWGSDVDYFVPDRLPSMPGSPARKDRIEVEALRNRVDLRIAKLDAEAVAKRHGLTRATRYVTDLELVSGAEIEREIETEYALKGGRIEETRTRKTVVRPQVELDFVIPVFDSGEARMRKAELAYMQAANLLAEKAVNIRSEARSAYTAYRATHDIARHYRNAVVPLRTTIEEQSLLTYNGMITNTFELLADTRAKVGTLLLAVNAKKQFWLADANLAAAVYGGGTRGAAPLAAASAGENSPGKH